MKTKTYYTTTKTPQGELLLLANETELTGLYFEKCGHVPKERETWTRDPKHPVLRLATEQLGEYFAGKRNSFSIPMRFAGTKFQERVWAEIARIPFGETISYSDLAKRAGKPKAVRAAGTNTGRNPLGIFIPCHRVMGKDGALHGFAGGLDWKRYLLGLERM